MPGRKGDIPRSSRPRWPSLKYERVYLEVFETFSEAYVGIRRWITCYNGARPPTALSERTNAEGPYDPCRHQVCGMKETRPSLARPPSCSPNGDHLSLDGRSGHRGSEHHPSISIWIFTSPFGAAAA